MKTKQLTFAIPFGVLMTVFSHNLQPCFGQVSPGGVGTTNLTAWFRGDDLPAGNISSWSTKYPTGAASITVTDGQAPYAQLETTPTGSISNYNRTLNFSGNSFSGMSNTNLQGLSLSSVPNLLDNANSNSQGSFFSAFYLPQPTASNGHMMLYNEGSDAIQLRNLMLKGRIALGLLTSNSVNASRDWNETFLPNIISYRGNRSNSSSMNSFVKGEVIPITTIPSQSSGIQGLYFGYSPTIATSAYNGYLHEFIFFNRDLTDIEMSKVHTYLAIKYGSTLSNAGGGTNGNYVATNGNTIWNASNQTQYHNDVIGIGRDDAEGLNQKQSHAFDDSTRIYINNLAAYNELNTGVFANDISYVLLGHNTQKLCGTLLSSVESPLGISSRIAREFKVTKTNFNQSFNWDIRIDTCNNFSNNLLIENLRLLVDDDGNFTNAQVFDQTSGITFTVINEIITVNNISSLQIPNNSTRYLSIGYVDVSFSIETTDPLCNGQLGSMVFQVENTTQPINVEYNDGTSTIQLYNVSSGDTLYSTSGQTQTFTFSKLPSPFNCCNVTALIDTIVTITQPLPLTISLSNDTTICENGTVSLFAQTSVPNCLIHWDFTTDTNASQQTQTQNNITYRAYAESQHGCVSQLDSTLVIVRPSITAQTSLGTTICPGYSDYISINGISGGLAPYNITWSSGETGTGNSMSIEVSPTTTQIYTVTVQDDCESTPLSLNISVTVAPLPVPLISVLDAAVCEPASFTLTNETDTAMVQSFTWIISDGQMFTNQETINTANMPAGNYDVQLIVTSPQGCVDSVTYTNYLTVFPLPTANFNWSPNPIQMFTTEVTMSNLSFLASDYQWIMPDASPSFSDQEEPIITFPDGETGEYPVTLIVTSDEGCKDSITQIIKVVPEVITYVPNTFTPDGDEFNQRWKITIEGIDIYDFNLLVFNRWGEVVWESNDPSIAWDATYKGQRVPTGSYTWVIKAGDALNNNKHIWKGNVNVLY